MVLFLLFGISSRQVFQPNSLVFKSQYQKKPPTKNVVFLRWKNKQVKKIISHVFTSSPSSKKNDDLHLEKRFYYAFICKPISELCHERHYTTTRNIFRTQIFRIDDNPLFGPSPISH